MKNTFQAKSCAILGACFLTRFAFAQSEAPQTKWQSVPVATIQAQDNEAISRPPVQPQFQPLQVSPDGRFLFVQVEEVKPLQDGVYPTERSLKVVQLQKGDISVLSRFQSVSGFDWFAGSSDADSAVQGTKQQSLSNKATSLLTIGQPTEQPPPNDVLLSFNPAEFKGKMVYIAFVRVAGTGDESQWRTFLVLRKAGQDVNTVQSYPVQVRKGDLFSPQWSPDSRHVLLKVGNTGDRYSVYLIHLWNPETNEVRPGPPEYISYLLPRWSPDSKHIAYIVGGDIAGRVDQPKPISLRVYDLITEKSQMLASGVPTGAYTLADFAWTRANTVLYTLPPQENSKSQPARSRRQNETAQAAQPTPARPIIYEVSAKGDPPQILIRDGFRPTPSPDGRWIAFFGWPDVEESRAEAADNPASVNYGPRLMLFDRTTKRRVLVSPNVFGLGTQGTQLLWTPDGKRLILMQTKYDSSTAQGEARISTIPMQSDK